MRTRIQRIQRDWGKARRLVAPLVAMMALATLAGCAGTSAQAPTASTPTVPATTQGRLTQRVQAAVGPAASAVEVTYQQAPGETAGVAVALVTLRWKPAWKTDFPSAQSLAKTVCYQTQAALWTSGVPLSKATVTVLGQALDDYGSVMTAAYAAASLTSAHAGAISWAATNADAAWSRYDEVFLRPLYGSDWMYPRPTTLPAHN